MRDRLGALRPRGSLWQNGDFVSVWSAATVSQFGTQVSLLALPFVAITTLKATTLEVAALGVAELVPLLLFGLPAGSACPTARSSAARHHRRLSSLPGPCLVQLRSEIWPLAGRTAARRHRVRTEPAPDAHPPTRLGQPRMPPLRRRLPQQRRERRLPVPVSHGLPGTQDQHHT